MIGAGNGREGQVGRGRCQLREQGWQALKGHHRLRFCRPYHDQQRTPDVGDMLQNVVFLLGSVLLNEDLGSHQKRYGINSVDQGPWLATVKMLLCLGRDACELFAALESGVSGIRKPRR